MPKTKTFLRLLLIIFIVNFPALVIAQPPLDDDNVLDNAVPFDGGVFVLVTVAIIYGFKKLYEKKKAGSL